MKYEPLLREIMANCLPITNPPKEITILFESGYPNRVKKGLVKTKTALIQSGELDYNLQLNMISDKDDENIITFSFKRTLRLSPNLSI